MSKRNKIIIAVIANVVALIAFVCFFGFVIGGRINFISYIAFAVFSALCGMGTLLFTDGKVLFKSKRLLEIALIAAVVLFFSCCFLYPNMNTLSAGAVEAEFESEIINAYTPKGNITGFIVVKDEKGNTVEIGDNYPDYVFDEYGDIACSAQIKRRQGGFGYPVYEITYIKK